jgi:hypothetical protein
MKKIALALAATAGIGMSGMANAVTPHHVQGYVYLSDTFISATSNVRYSTQDTTYAPYVSVYGYANSNVYIYGRSGDGATFSCYVPTTSALYQTAVDIRNNMDNGSHIYAYKSSSSTTNECSTVYMNHSSYLLD